MLQKYFFVAAAFAPPGDQNQYHMKWFQFDEYFFHFFIISGMRETQSKEKKLNALRLI
jgi:hypothetical protein